MGCCLNSEAKSPERVRFADFEFDCRNGELRRNGTSLRLQPQPAKVLAVLIRRAGEVVTRQELAEDVWGSETFVDFEQGLNYAVRQIRSALRDDAEQPRYLETLPKRGYRFIATVAPQVVESQREPPFPAAVSDLQQRQGRWYSSVAGLTTLSLAVALLILGWVMSRSGANRRSVQSLAVLPLRNLSNDPGQEYFTDGMTEELITDLAKSAGLRVISHTSVERYKNTTTPLPEIARQLGVDAIVEGTVMRSADKVRITAQLIDARSDRHLWADSYERDLRDVFSLQDEVAQQIAREIGVTLISARQPQTVNKRVLDPATQEAYLRGNFYWNQLNCGGFNKARSNFEQAVAGDPRFARAYVGLAETYFTIADWGCSADPALIAKSEAAALKALELDPSLGEAHAWLGKLAFFYEWDFGKAENELKQAIELSPNYPEAHMIYAVLLVSTGRRDPGLAEMRKAHDIDPISQLPNIIAVVVSYLARQYDTAIDQGRTTIELYPESVGTYSWLAAAYEKKGLFDQAIASYLKVKEIEGDSAKDVSAYRSAYEKAGILGYWQAELANAQRDSRPNPCRLTNIHAHLHNKAQALEFLDQSSQQHCSGPHTTLADPVFDEFRQDPKFKEVISRLHVPQ